MNTGTTLADRYRIVRPIAKGGMANIFEARDEAKQRVVVKVLKEGLSKDAEIVARFQRESRAAAKLTSPHVVRILDFGTTVEERPFIVMEYLFGNDLAKELEKRKVLPLEEAASYLAQACHAMVEAHDAGVIHRDLKPTNLFIAREGMKRILKVLDFGIAKVTSNDSEEQITRPTSLLGSPIYMSPETFRGAKNADARSDIWSLGVIFYEMMTGARPFTGENAAAVGISVIRQEHVPPTQRCPDLPRSVDVVCGRALKKEPDERYQTVREMLAALEVYLPRGRNDTMTMARVIAPGEDDDPRTVKRAVSVTDLGMINPTTAADLSDPPTRVVPNAAGSLAAALAGPPSSRPFEEPTTQTLLDVEPVDPPTKIRPLGASPPATPPTPGVAGFVPPRKPATAPPPPPRRAPAAQASPRPAPKIATPQAVVERVAAEHQAAEAPTQFMHAVAGPPSQGSPASQGSPPGSSSAGPLEAAAAPEPSTLVQPVPGMIADPAGSESGFDGSGPSSSAPSSDPARISGSETAIGTALDAPVEPAALPKRPIPKAALWLAPAAFVVGLGGWCLATSGGPSTAPGATGASSAQSDARPATTTSARNTAAIATASSEAVDTSAAATASAEAAGTASAEVATTEPSAAESTAVAEVEADRPAAGVHRPGIAFQHKVPKTPATSSAKTGTGKKKDKFTPSKI